MDINNFRLTVSLPCYGRPKRTIRAIECIAAQTVNNWQALVSGDGCPVMEDFISSGYFNDMAHECGKRGNLLSINNYPENKGGHGYAITNANIKLAKGKYFIFYANDDFILPNHFENYLSAIENTWFDFVYFNSIVEPAGMTRISRLEFGKIGHSELIIKTDFLQKMPPHDKEYGHDWVLINNMLAAGGKCKKFENKPTYIVKSLPTLQEYGID